MSDEMQTYIGTKEIKAKPMTRGEFVDYTNGSGFREGDLPEDEGYLVEYLDSPNSNHDNHENYISWSPKDVFYRAYQVAETYQDRMKIEMQDLETKYRKLNNFIKSDSFYKDVNAIDQHLLIIQRTTMKSLLHILSAREAL